jgi:hypothetical protein
MRHPRQHEGENRIGVACLMERLAHEPYQETLLGDENVH